MSENVGVRPDQVDAGVRAWEAAYTDLDNAWQGARGGIGALATSATWGGDAAGQAFEADFMANGGPVEVLFGMTSGGSVVGQLGQGAPSVRSVTSAELSTDGTNGAAIAATDQT